MTFLEEWQHKDLVQEIPFRTLLYVIPFQQCSNATEFIVCLSVCHVSEAQTQLEWNCLSLRKACERERIATETIESDWLIRQADVSLGYIHDSPL